MKYWRLLIPVYTTLILSTSFISPQTVTWTPSELNSANTAKNVTYMDSVEKEIVMYCNLARMYPKRFTIIEVDGHYYGEDATSLSKELRSINVRTALLPDSVLASSASCFQQEQEKSGATGHKREKCSENFYAENCSYGRSNAKSVVMQLLLDEGIPSHGHRWNILGTEYTKIGVAFGEHKKFLNCAVLDFK